MGVSYHKTYDIICVIDFAAEYLDHLEQHQRNQTRSSMQNSMTGSPSPMMQTHQTFNHTMGTQDTYFGNSGQKIRVSPNKSPQRIFATNNLMSNFQNFEVEEDEWLPGAVKCKEKKHSKVVNGMKITKVTKIYLMQNGETEIVENTFKEII